jgi:hypothetical protein
LHRVIIIGFNIFRFSEDYSQIIAVMKLGFYKYKFDFFGCTKKWLIINDYYENIYHIIDIENLELKIILKNAKKYLSTYSRNIDDYRSK